MGMALVHNTHLGNISKGLVKVSKATKQHHLPTQGMLDPPILALRETKLHIKTFQSSNIPEFKVNWYTFKEFTLCFFLFCHLAKHAKWGSTLEERICSLRGKFFPLKV